ncbi:methyltransferase family protein [Streptosporangium sp. NPDC000396]|uniref:methyltransferase family protein n=1 Tax=Streptosporangium sp. NPDC000396 TaxID=3366185 RepID=UPI00369563FB
MNATSLLAPAGVLRATGDPALIRGLAIMVPALAVVAAAARARPSERDIAAAILATGWNLLALIAVNTLALSAGWWEFHAEGAVVYGMPVDLLLGWALLWGALPVLATRPRRTSGRDGTGPGGEGEAAGGAWTVPLPLTAAVPAWFDLALMPRGEPVVVLGGDWLVGESVAIVTCLVPGLFLARWTVAGTCLRVRAGFQIVLAGGLGLALPVLLTGVWRQPVWVLGLLAQVLAVPMIFGVTAVREFATVGGGTPLPYDPPRRLVTTGPYAYVRNPMQVSMAAGYLVLAPFDPVFLGAAAVAAAYGAGLAAWHEGEQLARRFGAEWRDYHRAVRPWVPRLRPVMPPASVYVTRTCGPSGSACWRPRSTRKGCAGSPTKARTAAPPRGWPRSRTSSRIFIWAGRWPDGCSWFPGSPGSRNSAWTPSAAARARPPRRCDRRRGGRVAVDVVR